MALLRSIVTAAAATGTVPFNQDFTDATEFAGATPKAAIILGSIATAENTNALRAIGIIGFVAGGHQGGIGVLDNDGATPNTASYAYYTTQAYSMPNTGGSTDGDATGSLIANGLRLNWTDQSLGEIVKVILLGGTIEANVVSLASNNGVAAQSVAHGLTGTPDFIIALHCVGVINNDSNGNCAPAMGFWTSGAQVSLAEVLNTNSQTTVGSFGRVDSTHAIARKSSSNSNMVWTGLISGVGASTFNVTYSVANTETVIFLCVRSTGTPLAVKAGVYTTPTATGNLAVVSGMAAGPSVLLSILSQLPSADVGSNTPDGSSFGVGCALKTTAAANRYATMALYDEDGLATSANHASSQVSNTEAVRILGSGGVADIEATIQSWDSGGITLNFSNVNASARQIPYLAFGDSAVSVTITSVDDGLVYDGQTGVHTLGANFGATHTGTADWIVSAVDNVADASAVVQTIEAWAGGDVRWTANLVSFNIGVDLFGFLKTSAGLVNASGFKFKRVARWKVNMVLEVKTTAVLFTNQINIQYRVTPVSSINATPLDFGQTESTDGSAILDTAYQEVTPGGALNVGDLVMVSLYQANGTPANVKATLIPYLPTYV